MPRDAAAAVAAEVAEIEARKQQHNERVQRIVTTAIDMGVQPLTAQGEELQALDPHQLDAWVAENLQDAPAW